MSYTDPELIPYNAPSVADDTAVDSRSLRHVGGGVTVSAEFDDITRTIDEDEGFAIIQQLLLSRARKSKSMSAPM